jgi:hypothetical protein
MYEDIHPIINSNWIFLDNFEIDKFNLIFSFKPINDMDGKYYILIK